MSLPTPDTQVREAPAAWAGSTFSIGTQRRPIAASIAEIFISFLLLSSLGTRTHGEGYCAELEEPGQPHAHTERHATEIALHLLNKSSTIPASRAPTNVRRDRGNRG